MKIAYDLTAKDFERLSADEIKKKNTFCYLKRNHETLSSLGR